MTGGKYNLDVCMLGSLLFVVSSFISVNPEFINLNTTSTTMYYRDSQTPKRRHSGSGRRVGRYNRG